MIRKLILSFLLAFIATFTIAPSSIVMAEETNESDRASQEYDMERYELMNYSDDSWYELGDQTSNYLSGATKNMFWSTNVAFANLALMVVYQIFSLDLIDLTKDAVTAITSSVAGGLITGFGTFALAIFSAGLVIRAYIQQNWSAFFKLVSLVLLSFTLLFSISTERFDYVGLFSGLSKELGNVVMNVNPSLTNDSAPEGFQMLNPTLDEEANLEANSDNPLFNADSYVSATNLDNTAVALENKVFNALIYQPYLLLQYGTSNESDILAEDPERISAYLDADPQTEEGVEEREEITTEEYVELNNQTIFAGSGFQQSSYIFIMIVSTVVQGVVFFFIALIRLGLQFGLIMMLLLAPFAIFLSIFPTFETIVGKYLKTLFMVVLFQAITMFFILVSVSFISLGYDITQTTDDLNYRIFVQLIMSLIIIMMYSKRHVVMNMIEGSSLSLDDMGGGAVPGGRQAKQTAHKAGGVAKRAGGYLGRKGLGVSSKLAGSMKQRGTGAKQAMSSARSNFQQNTSGGGQQAAAATAATSSGTTASGGTSQSSKPSKFRQATAHVGQRLKAQQQGEDVSGKGNVYQGNSGEREATSTAKTKNQRPSKARKAKEYVSQQQRGEDTKKEGNVYQTSSPAKTNEKINTTSAKPTGQTSAKSQHIQGNAYTNTSAGGGGGSTKRKAPTASTKNKTQSKPVSSTKRRSGTTQSQHVTSSSAPSTARKVKKRPTKNNGQSSFQSSKVSNPKYAQRRSKQSSGSSHQAHAPTGKRLTKGELKREAYNKQQLKENQAKEQMNNKKKYDQINRQNIEEYKQSAKRTYKEQRKDERNNKE